MLENRTSGSEGGAAKTNRPFLPLSSNGLPNHWGSGHLKSQSSSK